MATFSLPMRSWSPDKISIVQPNMEMEAMPSNALIATPVPPSKPLISDIYAAIQNQNGPEHTPTAIMTFPPDYILQFPTPKSRDIVYTSKVIQGDYFVLTLQPWTSSYRCLTLPWNTKVTVQIKGIPPHAFHRDTLTPLLASHCDIQTYCFNPKTSICTVNAFTYSIQAIPEQTYLGLSHQSSEGRAIHTYPITFETTTYIDHEDTNNSTSSSDTAELFGVDPDVLRETYEELWKAEDALNKKNDLATSDTTDSLDYNYYEPASPDRRSYESMSSGLSNHEPKFW